MAEHTPGPWAIEVDPIDDRDYKVLVVIPSKAGFPDTWIARAEHNWNEAGAGEHRISWAEAEANARLMAAAPDGLALAELAMKLLGPAAVFERDGVMASLKPLFLAAESLIAKATTHGVSGK